jgi:hypothetical protein
MVKHLTEAVKYAFLPLFSAPCNLASVNRGQELYFQHVRIGNKNWTPTYHNCMVCLFGHVQNGSVGMFEMERNDWMAGTLVGDGVFS